MNGPQEAAPRVVAIYGLLGLVPFWALATALVLAPNWAGIVAAVVAVYAALILSFLGGARWGLEVRATYPDPIVIGLAMTPTLAGLAVISLAHGHERLQLLALAATLTLSWAWDVHARDLPLWYGGLRTLLTAGAVGGLCVGALMLPGSPA